MKWKKRAAELEALKAKHGGNRPGVAFPDLKVERTYPSLGNGFAPIQNVKPPMSPEQSAETGLIVDTLHKQGMQVLFKSDLPWAGGKKS